MEERKENEAEKMNVETSGKTIESTHVCPYAPRDEINIKKVNEEPQSVKAQPVSASHTLKAEGGEQQPETPPVTKPSNDDGTSFIDELYNAISSAIGASADNQYFCLLNPGTSVDKSQYSYDIENGEEKPAHVVANESKLVNKLFDPAFVLSSDNGRHLQTQYQTALNVLTPKLNSTLFEAKSLLRNVLRTPYPYNFGDGSDDVLTLEQVYYKLYGDYVAEKKNWANMRNKIKEELRNKYKTDSPKDNAKRTDGYLEWYATEGESQELLVEEKLGKVLSVFSPGDMEIINGILDSGAGREITEAKQMLSNAEMLNPSGGKVYPVTLYPQNWFNLLNSSVFKGDRLDTPAAITPRLKQKILERNKLQSNINRLTALIPSDDTIAKYLTAYNDAEKAYSDAMAALSAGNTDITIDMVKTFVDIVAAQDANTEEGGKDASKVPESTVSKVLGIDINKVSGILDSAKDAIKTALANQQNVLNTSKSFMSHASELMSAKNLKQYKPALDEYINQLSIINSDIEDLQTQLNAAMKLFPDSKINSAGSSSPAKYASETVDSLAANEIPEGFQQVLITKSASTLLKESSNSSSSSTSSGGAAFIFGGYSQQNEHSEAIASALDSKNSVEIQVAMSVAKVNIEREWFEPGVFMLSKDMINTSNSRIAPESSVSFSSSLKDEVKKRFNEMEKCLFPSYPVAFVVAKDVSIRFTSENALSYDLASSIEDHSSKGGGFLIFSGSSAKNSSSSNTSSSTSTTANSITIRFANPQILGYYIEAIPEDKSVNISSANVDNDDYMSVITFIEKFRDMLEDMKNYKK